MALHSKVSLVCLLLASACGPSNEWQPPPMPNGRLLGPTLAPAATASEPTGGSDDFDDAVAAPADPIPASELPARIAQFAPAKIEGALAKLPASERAALDKLIAASKLLEPIFARQVYAQNPDLEAQLAQDTSAEGQSRLTYFRIMRGPWDRQDHHRPFAIERAHPPGAGFYPDDLDAAELDAYVAAHPNEATKLLDLFTVVKRDGDRLVPVPYSEAYRQWLDPSAKLLREAATLTKNASLATFLRSRADAFASDDYYASDKDWMDLDSQLEITIGPYETYEDRMKEAKASFESFVTVADPDASAKLAKYKDLLADMENHLPVPDHVKAKRGRESPIRVVDLVFSAGDARKSVMTIAFNLPNDERVRKEKGAKKVLLRNVIQAKFDRIMRPIAERILDPAQQKYLSSDAFFHEVLFHELSHSLGPAFTKKDGKDVDVRVALEETYSSIEECKADVMGAYNILYMIERKELPASFREELLVSYFAGLFRSVRFGVAEAHGKGAAVQINRFLEEGAARFDAASGRFTIDLPKLEASIRALVRDLCLLQHEGDKAKAKALLEKYAVMSESMKTALASVSSVPVDLRPSYPAAGE